MKITNENIKKLIKEIGFIPQDGTNDIFYKKYVQHKDYVIRVNFNNEKIEYRNDAIKQEDSIQLGDLTTSNFENSENFVVLECVNRLLEKGFPRYVLYALANIGFKNIEAMATGQSGQIELGLPIINSIKIPLPSIDMQKEIVAKIEVIEREMTMLENELEKAEERKREILESYLK